MRDPVGPERLDEILFLTHELIGGLFVEADGVLRSVGEVEHRGIADEQELRVRFFSQDAVGEPGRRGEHHAFLGAGRR